MMIAYTLQSSNPDKHELMPDDYFFEKYEIEDSRQSEFENKGFTVVSPEDFSTIMGAISITAYNSAVNPISGIVNVSIMAAENFGLQLMNQFVIENVLMGITQAGKTVSVTTYLHKLSHYMMTGSLYAAIIEVDSIIADTGKDSLSPFVTNDRMIVYKHKIQDYLGIAET